jgi:hypothetical protein
MSCCMTTYLYVGMDSIEASSIVGSCGVAYSSLGNNVPFSPKLNTFLSNGKDKKTMLC